MKVTLSGMYHVMNFSEKMQPYKLYDTYENLLNPQLIDFKKNELPDWTIRFWLMYRDGNEIMVCKKKKSLVTDKMKEIVIHIPIPSNKDIEWGVNAYELFPTPFHPKRAINCSIFPVNWADFDNLLDFVHYSIKKGIDHSFKDGFTVMGHKIKIEEDLFK